jgi:eukaryotic-like serine/threonine-protein kinase
MGVVYKAEDTRLHRAVALKFLPENLARDSERRQRLWSEARAAARVTHPNACRLYDIAEEDGRLMLVMELVEGESLARRIARGAVPVKETAQIVLGILAALEALHKSGIVHRDLKPENILLAAEGVKVLDFGIAKHVSEEGADGEATLTGMTLPGEFLGTPRYASPEQFRGGAVDAHSDIFSVGAIVFEMLAPKPAFRAQGAGAVARGTVRERGEDGRGRPRGAAAQGIETTAHARALRRMIVLPFRLLRTREEIQFLCHSLPEAISISLAEVENLTVRSSLAAARYESSAPDFQTIGKEAEVDVILTGALLPVGEQLRLTTQLVEAPSGTLLWSHSSQATVRELLELHDDLVQRVMDALLPSLSAGERAAPQRDRAANPTAYRLYLEANEAGRRWDNLPEAIRQYEECLRLDPKYAAAWARLGRARWLWDKYSFGSQEGLRSAEEAFQKALALNPELPLTHHLYTHLQVDQGRALDALRRLLQRVRVRRSDAELFSGLGHVSRYCGLLQEALVAHQEARRLDPQIATTVNHTYFMLGEYGKALEHSSSDYGYGEGMILAMLGRQEEAIRALREYERTKPPRLGMLYLTSLRALLEGKREESLEASRELMKATFRDPEGIYYLARQLGFLGAREEALETLRRAVERGFFCYPAMVRDPWLDGMRGDEEFSRVLNHAHELHREAQRTFVEGGGEALLGVARA